MRVRALVAVLAAWAACAGAAAAAPTAPSVAGGSASWTPAVSVDLTASGGTGGVVGYEYRTSSNQGSTWSAPVAGTTATIPFDGETWVQFRSVDGVGGVSPWAPAHSPSADPAGLVRIDRYAPPIPSGPAGPAATAAAPAITWPAAADAGDSGIAGYQVLRDGTQVTATAGTSFTDTGAPEGTLQYRVRAVDAAGNVSLQSAAATVVHDTTPPGAPTVTGGAADPVSRDAVRVQAAGAADALSGVAGYEHRTSEDDGGSWTVPLGGGVVDVTREGRTLIQFRAVDAAGNAGPWTPAHPPGAPSPEGTVHIDRTAPGPGSAPSGSRYPLVVRWPEADGAELYAVLRNGIEAARVSGRELTDLDAPDLEAPPAPGTPTALVPARGRVLLAWPAVEDRGSVNRYAVRPLDLAGNAGADSPSVPLAALSGVAGYEVHVDGRLAVRTASPSARISGLDPDRTYSFSVIARDAAGNVSERSPSLGVRPTPGPNPRIALASERDAVRPNVPLTLRATVTGPTGGPITWDLGDGTTGLGPVVTHRFTAPGARVVSASVPGPTGRPVRVTRRIVVDGVPPRVRIRVVGNRLTAAVGDDRSGVAWVVLMGRPPQEIPPGGLLVPDGRRSLWVRGADRAGNATDVRRVVLVDGTVPRLRVTAPPASTAPAVDAVVSVGDATSGVASLTVDGRELPIDRRVVTLATGRPHVVVAVDRRGNRSRVRLVVRRVRPAPERHPALDGARRDQLRYRFSERPASGARRTLLVEVQTRLIATGRLPAGWRVSHRYTERLLRTVQAYQRQAGLPVVGTIGPSTRAALARDAARPVAYDPR